MKKELKDITAEAGTIKAQVLEDARGTESSVDDVQSYINNVANHGCQGGSCRGLIFYADTHAFYNRHAEEIDSLLEELAEEMGEPYDITGNMKRMRQSDLRNFLAWLAYELRAQEIQRELDGDE